MRKIFNTSLAKYDTSNTVFYTDHGYEVTHDEYEIEKWIHVSLEWNNDTINTVSYTHLTLPTKA